MYVASCSRPGSHQASINGSNKTAGGARTFPDTPAGVVILGESRGLDLLQRHAFLDGVLHAVAHNGDHVAIFHHIEFVADTAVTRNDIRSAFLLMLGNRDIDDIVQGVDLALNAASAFHINKGIAI